MEPKRSVDGYRVNEVGTVYPSSKLVHTMRVNTLAMGSAIIKLKNDHTDAFMKHLVLYILFQ
jgi:hypothetical protein